MTAVRTRNAAQTKARIVEAARHAFSTRGYAQIGMREIAQAAGVATSLIDRHFGTKAQLFEAVLLDTLAEAPDHGERSSFGQRLRAMLSEPDLDIQGLLMSVLAAGDPEASRIAAGITEQRIVAPVAEWLGGGPDAHLRAVRMNAIVVGYLIQARYLSPQPNGQETELLLDRVSREVQAIVDEIVGQV
jgi:AcrR family transcriptional regulator